ncbi:hypothetical protein ACOTD7_19305 [Achromobacter xylosoxidans]
MIVAAERPGLIQHKLRPEVKKWIEATAKEQERSQAWILNRIVEEAYESSRQRQEARQ